MYEVDVLMIFNKKNQSKKYTISGILKKKHRISESHRCEINEIHDVNTTSCQLTRCQTPESHEFQQVLGPYRGFVPLVRIPKSMYLELFKYIESFQVFSTRHISVATYASSKSPVLRSMIFCPGQLIQNRCISRPKRIVPYLIRSSIASLLMIS